MKVVKLTVNQPLSGVMSLQRPIADMEGALVRLLKRSPPKKSIDTALGSLLPGERVPWLHANIATQSKIYSENLTKFLSCGCFCNPLETRLVLKESGHPAVLLPITTEMLGEVSDPC